LEGEGSQSEEGDRLGNIMVTLLKCLSNARSKLWMDNEQGNADVLDERIAISSQSLN
jgi:hypothetical protein